MRKDKINEYIKKYGYDFVLDACDEAENRHIYVRQMNNKKHASDINKLKEKAKRMGVKLKGDENE